MRYFEIAVGPAAPVADEAVDVAQEIQADAYLSQDHDPGLLPIDLQPHRYFEARVHRRAQSFPLAAGRTTSSSAYRTSRLNPGSRAFVLGISTSD